MTLRYPIKAATWLLATLLAVGLASMALAAEPTVPSPARGKMRNFTLLPEAKPVPEIGFIDAMGQPHTLQEFQGRVVLLNFWATWCAPCRREMPALDRLQAKLGGDDFMVLALSQDRKGPPVVTAFLQKIAVANLAVYVDPTSRSARAFGAYGLPATVLLDRQGRALGRMVGPAEWDSDDAIKLFRHFMAKGTKAADKS
ncbi:MAG TPA: redoxin family protein [Alphaproteobacteria bacterium]|jgi:thiol-disulfide isomerase/thioredoxin|nr:redoxin family protein [Alphaproteobacteria bacterium]